MNRVLSNAILICLLWLTSCSPKTSTESKQGNDNETSKLWRDTDTLSVRLNCSDRIFPTQYRILDANNEALKKLLVKEGSSPGALSPDTIQITIPLPNGTWEQYSINQIMVMSQELAAKYPDIKTYAGKSKIFPSDNIRLDVSQQGVRVMIQSTRGAMMIDPYCKNDQMHVISYFRKNLPANAKEDFER